MKYVLLLAGGLVAYLNAFQGVFHFDDAGMLDDGRLASLSCFATGLGAMIRPLAQFTFFIDRSLWGADPAGYHLFNLSLHLGSGLLVHAIARRLEAGSRVAFFTALLFLVHPIATETVTYVSGRATGLMAFFYLAGLYFYLRAGSAKSWAYAATVACFVLSLLSKEIAITFPLALLLVEVAARQSRGAHLRERLLQLHLPIWSVLLLYLFAAMFHPRYAHLLEASLSYRPAWENLVMQTSAVAYAISLFFLPARLTFEHDIALEPAASILLLLALLASAFLLRRRVPLASFGLFWFFLQLLPTNSVLPRYDLLSERNLYLAAPGLILAIVSLWFAAMARIRAPTLVAAAALAAAVPFLIAATLARNAIYADPVTFWAAAVRNAPARARPRVNLGYAHYLAGDVDRAIAEFRLALAMDPDNHVARANLLAAWRREPAANSVSGSSCKLR